MRKRFACHICHAIGQAHVALLFLLLGRLQIHKIIWLFGYFLNNNNNNNNICKFEKDILCF